MSQAVLETEWSYFINVSDLETGTNGFSVSPSSAALGRLAQRLGLNVLESLDADVEIINAESSLTFHVKATFKAKVEQACVVTLEPVVAEIDEAFEAWFADPEQAIPLAKAKRERDAEKGHGEVKMLEEHEDPEPIVDGRIDLGELITQHLSLAINPYPHAEGVEFEVGVDQQKDFSKSVNNPFAALKDWKDKLDT